MPSSTLCPACQRPVDDRAPHDLCPACLVGAVINDDDLPAAPDPTPAELSPGASVHYFGDYELLGATTSDRVGTEAQPLDPRLDPLANNGGKTQTLMLQRAGPARQAVHFIGVPGHPLSFDQRGVPRHGNGASDIAAVDTSGDGP